MPERMGPGPEERKLRNRIYFWWFRRWPNAVVHERLTDRRWDTWPHGSSAVGQERSDG